MTRSFLVTAALAALVVAPALAQQTGTPPASTDAMPNTRTPGMTQNNDQRTAPMNQPGMSAQADITAERLQGLAIYTTKVDAANATVVTGNTGTTTTGTSTTTFGTAGTMTDNRMMTKAELKAMTDRAQSVGEVNDLLIGLDGKIHHAILDVGGFLGVGERSVTVAWTDLKIMRTNEGDLVAFIDKSKNDLKALPEYKAPSKR